MSSLNSSSNKNGQVLSKTKAITPITRSREESSFPQTERKLKMTTWGGRKGWVMVGRVLLSHAEQKGYVKVLSPIILK